MDHSPLAIVSALHAALAAGKHGEELRPFFTADAITVERPNALKPSGATYALEDVLRNSSTGATILAQQAFEVHTALEAGSMAVVKLTWTGEMARDVGRLRKGQQLKAHIAQFIETRQARIARIETYDCYEPFAPTTER